MLKRVPLRDEQKPHRLTSCCTLCPALPCLPPPAAAAVLSNGAVANATAPTAAAALGGAATAVAVAKSLPAAVAAGCCAVCWLFEREWCCCQSAGKRNLLSCLGKTEGEIGNREERRGD